MTRQTPGRHRAPRRSTMKPLAQAAATVAVSGGMIAIAPAAQAAPAAPAAVDTAVASSVVTTVHASPTVWRTIRYGARGTAVKRVQHVVKAVPDGIFGPKTLRAVRHYQSGHHLVPDGIVGPLTARSMRLTSTAPVSRSYARTAPASGIIGIAASYTGIWYRWGGATPAGFDCSGYTQYVYKKAGINLPRSASGQQQAATRVSTPRAGDLVFFGYPAHHVGIYAGNGYMYDSGKPGLTTQKRKVFSGSHSYGRV